MYYISNNAELNGEEILNIFVKSGLHIVGNDRVNWSECTVCVCLVTFLNERKTLLIKQNRRCYQGDTLVTFHAEHDIIEFLRYNINWIRSVKIFCNFSPCSKPNYECCYSIRKIKEDLKSRETNWGVDSGERSLTFVFSHLYKIERPSCRGKGCSHKRPKGNDRSLNNLRSLGTSIRSFEMADWVALIELLALWDTQRRKETGTLTSFRFGEEYGSRRDSEDAKMKEDFQYLRENGPL